VYAVRAVVIAGTGMRARGRVENRGI
jgi:hypothetical protein